MKRLILTTAFLVFVMAIAILSSCTKDYFVPAETPENVSFSVDIQPFFDAKCIGCHGNIAPPKLEDPNTYMNLINGNYIDIANPASSLLYTKINVGGTMAQYCSPDERALTLKWIEQGALDN